MPRNLGGIERKPDDRDFKLGSIQAPLTIPPAFIPDISWLIPNHQGQTPTCGAHASSHFQAILEHEGTLTATQHYTPRFSWIDIKGFDGFPLEDGTDMRSIFKSLQNTGADWFDPLENDVTLPLATYSDKSVITPQMMQSAATNKIQSYAFGDTDFRSLCQHIYQNKAVLLLIKCDDGFWGTTTPSFTTPKYGHFVTAYGYTPNSIKIIDSADTDYPFKEIGKEYILPKFIIESGTAIDLPPAQVQAIINSSVSVAQEVAVSTLPAQQKISVLQTILTFLYSLMAQKKVGSTAQPTSMFINESNAWNWLIVSSADPTKSAATVKGALGVLVAVLAFYVHGPNFANLPDDAYTIVVDAFGVFSAVVSLGGLIRKTYLSITQTS